MTTQRTVRDVQAPYGFEELGDEPVNPNPPQPTPQPDDKEGTPVVCGPRPRVASSVILAPNGSNYISWKTVMPSVLDGEPYAWEVTKGTLNPPGPDKANTPEGKTQMKNFTIGNRAARYVLMNSIHPNLAVSLFLDNAETVEAQEIWRRIKHSFTKKNGGLKEIALTQFMKFKYEPSVPVGDNLLNFRKIVYRMNSLGVSMDDEVQCTKLLESLPSSWEPFRQGWSARTEQQKHLEILIELIEAESLRRGQFDTDEITAMFSRFTARGSHFRKKNFQRTTTVNSEVTCYNCNQRGHMQAQCRLPRRGLQQGRGYARGRSRNRGGRTRQPQPQINITEALIVECGPIEINNAVLDEEFVVDSGTTHHMVNNLKWMTDYRPFEESREVKLGGSRALSAQGVGVAQVTTIINGKSTTLKLSEALYVPKLRRNLISVGILADDGLDIKVSRDAIKIIQGQDEIEAKRCNGLFVLSMTEEVQAEGNIAKMKKKMSLLEAHKKFCHINVKTIKQMLEREGHEVVDDFVHCDVCTRGKMHRASFKPKPKSVVAPRTGYIHADLCAVSTKSFGGANYFLTLTDDLSRFRKVYFLQSKDETAECI